MTITADLRAAAQEAKAWPFVEARRLLDRVKAAPPEKGYVLFETGYGPSGLPHIGTFGEVLRTSMVRRAFQLLSDMPTRLYAFSDDMDGLRRVPDNVPNRDVLTANLDRPLTSVPDPFGKFDSFGAHNNAMLREFLDRFGFDYEFISATDCYQSGRFDAALLRVLARYEEVMRIMLPSLRGERAATYSPFLPVDAESGRVLQVPVIATDAAAGRITYRREDGQEIETGVTGGRCKLQWKPDWAMRWVALDVDYEMSGKDLIESMKLSTRICRALGGTPPDGFSYEHFLDEAGEKISKSRGNGLTIDEWLTYAPNESLALFMFQKPRTAKRLYFDVIPKSVDDYLSHRAALTGQTPGDRLENPAWHIHQGHLPESGPEDATEAEAGATDRAATRALTFAILLNLAAACNSEDESVLWGFIARYAPAASPERDPYLDRMVGHAIRYYRDFVKPNKCYAVPDARDSAALADLRTGLAALPADADGETIQTLVYDIGKRHGYTPLRAWFQALYRILLGQEQGPRIGSFFAIYGRDESLQLIDRMLAGAGADPTVAAETPAS